MADASITAQEGQSVVGCSRSEARQYIGLGDYASRARVRVAYTVGESARERERERERERVTQTVAAEGANTRRIVHTNGRVRASRARHIIVP
jgi:hypothetical protein